MTFAVCFFYAPLHGQNLQCAGPDDDAVAQFQKANSEAVAAFNEICKVIRLQPNEKIEVLPNEGAFVVRPESDAGQSDVVIPYTDFVNPDLPAGQLTQLAIWLQVPDGIDDFPDFVVPLLSAIFKRKDDSGQFAVPGHAAALTQWRNDLIVWEYDKGKLIEVKQFHPKVPQAETGRRLIEEFLSGQ